MFLLQCNHLLTLLQVGGDFYDFFFIDSTHFAFLVADVSDKGIPAAMFMMKAKTIIKSLAQANRSADEIICIANNALCEDNEADMFVTLWFGILDTDKISVVYQRGSLQAADTPKRYRL